MAKDLAKIFQLTQYTQGVPNLERVTGNGSYDNFDLFFGERFFNRANLINISYFKNLRSKKQYQ